MAKLIHSTTFNLLDEPLLGVEDDADVRARVTLPGLLARLSQGRESELTARQAHQQHATHAFLVQLAAIAMVRAGTSEIARDEQGWRELLLGAAAKDGAGPEAFCLVVDDLKKPAFMQPAVPEGSLAALRSEHLRPSEELDVLITSKNHDVKVHPIEAPTPEHWFLALVTLQTMQGFLGAGNYGIARMNGGFSSRPCIAYASDLSSASRFLRDLSALLGARNELLPRFARQGGIGLLWCVPWDGTTSLGFDKLDPYFIEICRRIRLRRTESGTIVAYRGSSKAARVDGSAFTGNTGDAWTPVATKDGKALTLTEAGFTYERVRDYLFSDSDWQHGAAGRLGSGDRYWLGQVLVRGQGKTGGYHERWIPVPPKARRILGVADERARLGKRAKDWVDLAGTVRLRVLKPALLTLLQGAPEKLKFDDDRADPFLARYERSVDRDFFALLFEHAEASPEDADREFEVALARMARNELESAFGSVPLSAARKPRAIAQAERTFSGAAHHQLKNAFLPSAPRDQGDSQ